MQVRGFVICQPSKIVFGSILEDFNQIYLYVDIYFKVII